MKPILINIGEMSDSREVYESKPNIFFTIFIYTVLGMLLTALTWMYFGRIDIVVKSEGMLRPNNQVATVINTYTGTLQEVNIKDGSYINEGDVLYVIEHGDLLTELDYYQEQLTDAKSNRKLLEKYKQSIEDGVNYFTQTSDEEEYFIKYQGFELNYELMKNDYSYSDKERELNLESVTEQLAVLNTQLGNTRLLKQAVEANKNLFTDAGSEKEYYDLFIKYQSDYASIITKYKNVRIEIDNSTTEEGLINSLAYYKEMQKGLEQLQESINKGESVFDDSNYYSLQYEEYINKVKDLTAAYEQAEENYEINKELAGLAVTEWEVEQSKAAMEEADRAIAAYQADFLANVATNLTQVQKNIDDAALSKENTISKDKLYEQNEEEKVDALENYKLQYTVELDKTISSIEDNITNLKANKESLKLQGEKTLVADDTENTEASLLEYKNKELSTTISSIISYTDQINELETNIDKMNSQIDAAVVKASKSGIINNNIELVEGDTLSSGTEVLTILPGDDSEYKVNIYVSNEDIGKLKVGMKAKFNVYALPNTEYGYLTGTITKISKDLKVDTDSGSGYYLVEAELDHKELYDEQGQEAALKAGMTCQAQMITESKRILTYVLEKIDLWIH